MTLHRGHINFARVRPWWVRLLLLFVVAWPLFTGATLHPRIHLAHAFRDLAMWSAYAMFIWLFIAICIGLERLLQWLSVAGVFGLTVTFTGAALRQLKIWELLQRLIASVGASTPSGATQQELDLIFRLLMILISLPLALLALNSFAAVDVLRRMSRKHEHTSVIAIGVAVFLRIFQHVFEVATTFLTAWREENPSSIVPRYRTDWERGLKGRLGFFSWARSAIWTWSIGLLMHSLIFIPVAVRDWERFVSDSKEA